MDMSSRAAGLLGGRGTFLVEQEESKTLHSCKRPLPLFKLENSL